MLKRRSCRYGYVVAIAACGLSAVDSVRAADSGPYVGFDLGWAQYPQYYAVISSEAVMSSGTVWRNSTLDRDRVGWSVSAGYQFNRYLSAEASFVDLGSIAGSLTDSSGVTVSSGSSQSATVATAYASPLKVLVTDQYGNP